MVGCLFSVLVLIWVWVGCSLLVCAFDVGGLLFCCGAVLFGCGDLVVLLFCCDVLFWV